MIDYDFEGPKGGFLASLSSFLSIRHCYNGNRFFARGQICPDFFVTVIFGRELRAKSGQKKDGAGKKRAKSGQKKRIRNNGVRQD